MPAPAPATAPGDPPRAAVAFIFITVFIDLLGVGVLIPVIPTIVRQFAQGGFVACAQSGYEFGHAAAH